MAPEGRGRRLLNSKVEKWLPKLKRLQASVTKPQEQPDKRKQVYAGQWPCSITCQIEVSNPKIAVLPEEMPSVKIGTSPVNLKDPVEQRNGADCHRRQLLDK